MDKISSSLTTEQLQDFCKRLAQVKGPTLKKIQELAGEWGIDISLMSATSFRDGPFARHLARLRRGKEMTDAILGAVREGSSALDASEELAAQELLDVLTEVDEDERPDVGKLSGTILNLRMAASARRGDERKDRETEKKLELADQRIAKLEREKTEWDEQRAKITAQLARVTNAPAASADEVRAAAVAEIDAIMGIKPKKK